MQKRTRFCRSDNVHFTSHSAADQCPIQHASFHFGAMPDSLSSEKSFLPTERPLNLTSFHPMLPSHATTSSHAKLTQPYMCLRLSSLLFFSHLSSLHHPSLSSSNYCNCSSRSSRFFFPCSLNFFHSIICRLAIHHAVQGVSSFCLKSLHACYIPVLLLHPQDYAPKLLDIRLIPSSSGFRYFRPVLLTDFFLHSSHPAALLL